MGVIKVEQFQFDQSGTSNTLAITDVSSTGSAFIRNTCSGRQTAGRTDNTTTSKHDYHGGTIKFSATNELTFTRYNSTGTVRYFGEVWRYIGAGGEHEFINRGQISLNFGASDTIKSQSISGISNLNKVVPFLVGQMVDDAGNSSFNDSRFECYMSGSNELVVGRNVAGPTGDVVVDVVEFTGTSWSVGFGIVEEFKESANKTVNLNDQYDGSGSAFTATYADGFIEASHQGDTDEVGLSDVLVAFDNPVGTSGTTLTITSADSAARNDGRLRVYWIENSSLSIARQTTNTSIPQGTNTSLTFPSISPSSLDEAALEWYLDTNGTGQAFARGFAGAYLTSTSQISSWQHRSGNTGYYRYGVMDLSGLTEAGAPSSEIHSIDSILVADISKIDNIATTDIHSVDGLEL